MKIQNMLFALACALGIGAATVGCDDTGNTGAADMAAVARDLSTGPADIAMSPPDMATCSDPNIANPTHAQIINACTTAQKIDKTPKLPAPPCM